MLQVRYGVAQHLIEGGPAEGGFDLVRERGDLEVPVGGPRGAAVEAGVEAVAKLGPIGECRARRGRCGVFAEACSDHHCGMAGQESVGDRVQVRTQLLVDLKCGWSGHGLQPCRVGSGSRKSTIRVGEDLG